MSRRAHESECFKPGKRLPRICTGGKGRALDAQRRRGVLPQTATSGKELLQQALDLMDRAKADGCASASKFATATTSSSTIRIFTATYPSYARPLTEKARRGRFFSQFSDSYSPMVRPQLSR